MRTDHNSTGLLLLLLTLSLVYAGFRLFVPGIRSMRDVTWQKTLKDKSEKVGILESPLKILRRVMLHRWYIKATAFFADKIDFIKVSIIRKPATPKGINQNGFEHTTDSTVSNVVTHRKSDEHGHSSESHASINRTVQEQNQFKPTMQTYEQKPADLKQQTRMIQQDNLDTGTTVVSMLERTIASPEILETMYPYLPASMRNKEYFEWMLSNPVARTQLESMLKKQSPPLDLKKSAIGDIPINPVKDGMYKNKKYYHALYQIRSSGLCIHKLASNITNRHKDFKSIFTKEAGEILEHASINPMFLINRSSHPLIGSLFQKLRKGT